MRGRSAHNQRIERLWGDVWRGTVNVYHSLFTLLEEDGLIDPTNEKHMWALHYVYLPRLNRDLNIFVNQWNHHRLDCQIHVTIPDFCERLPCNATSSSNRDRGIFRDEPDSLPQRVATRDARYTGNGKIPVYI